MSLGPGHNPTESLVEMLEGTGFDTPLDKAAAAEGEAITSIRSARVIRSFCRISSAWRRRSSRARFRAA